jgi:hypothetical protein
VIWACWITGGVLPPAVGGGGGGVIPFFLEVRNRDDRYIPVRLLHELRGYLTACGCDLIPLDDRCPLAWRLGSSFNAVRDLWITDFFHESERRLFAVPLPLSARSRIVLPLRAIIEAHTQNKCNERLRICLPSHTFCS